MVRLRHYVTALCCVLLFVGGTHLLAAEEYTDMQRVQCFTKEQLDSDAQEAADKLDAAYNQGAYDFLKFMDKYMKEQCKSREDTITLRHSNGDMVLVRCP